MSAPLRHLMLLAILATLACSADREGTASPEPLPAAEVADRIGPILSLEDPLQRSYEAAALLRRAPQEAQPALQAAFEATAQAPGAPELVTFVMWWADFEPLQALAWTQKQPEPDPVLIASVFRVLAHDRPLVAFNLLETLPGNLSGAIVGEVVASWHGSGQAGLVERVQTITDLAAQQSVSEHLARSIVAEHGAAGALARVEQIEDAGFREMLLLRIASAAADEGEGELIAQWATPRITAGTERPSGMARRVGTRWIRNDPEAALAWLESLPAGLDRDDGVMESFRDWTSRDREAATAWAEATPIARWNEPAFSIYLRLLGQEQPAEALTRLGEFEDAQLRSRMMRRIARNWLVREPDAAVAWIEEAEVLPRRIRATLAPWIAQAREASAAGSGQESARDGAQPEPDSSSR